MSRGRPREVSVLLIACAKERRLPVFHPWGSSLRSDLARLDLRRRFRRAGLGDAKKREQWIGELT